MSEINCLLARVFKDILTVDEFKEELSRVRYECNTCEVLEAHDAALRDALLQFMLLSIK